MATTQKGFVDDDTIQKLHDENRQRHMETMKNIVNGDFPKDIKHPRIRNEDEVRISRPIWNQDEIQNVKFYHHQPQNLSDRLAYLSILWIRFVNDLLSGWIFGRLWGWFTFSETNWMLRICLYESIGNVPASMFAIARHINSLRWATHDNGWIHSLLLEADAERMHLLFALHLYNPGVFFRYFILAKEFAISSLLLFVYLFNPLFCHRFAAYLEEAAVLLYSELLTDINKKHFPLFERECVDVAKNYYQLPDGAKWSDVFANIRCDEAYHREVHHTLAPLSLKPESRNPFHNKKCPIW